MTWETKKLLFFVPLILVLDLLLLIDINKKNENNQKVVLGTQTFVKRKISAKKNPPKIDLAYIEKRYPTLSPTLSPNPTIVEKSKDIVKITTTPPPDSSSTSVQTSSQSNSIVISGNSLIDQVNAFRSSKGLSAVHSDSYTCAFATIRSNEITSSFSHDGFNNRAASHTLPYPSYSSVTENIALNSDPMQVVNAWIGSPGHNENMQKDTPNVCIANSGNYYVYEGWKP